MLVTCSLVVCSNIVLLLIKGTESVIIQTLYDALSEQNYNDLSLRCEFFEWEWIHTGDVVCALRCTSHDCFAFGHNASGCAVCHRESPGFSVPEWGSLTRMFKKGE